MLGFKQSLLEWGKDPGKGGGGYGEGIDDSRYPYLIKHDHNTNTVKMDMPIVGGGPATVIEWDDIAKKIAAQGTPVSVAYMTLARSNHVHELYKTNPDMARHAILSDIEAYYHHDGQQVKRDWRKPGEFKDGHPSYDTLGAYKS